jgi:hypothetical protein
MTIKAYTGSDNLRAGSNAIMALNISGQPTETFSINQGQQWTNDSLHSIKITFQQPIVVNIGNQVTVRQILPFRQILAL